MFYLNFKSNNINCNNNNNNNNNKNYNINYNNNNVYLLLIHLVFFRYNLRFVIAYFDLDFERRYCLNNNNNIKQDTPFNY
ncbi:hypothetical protein H8356DRAFT_1360318 [Neocallimastix lanati (nom. inval.)]|nr:hypothetical protein H8356DRAFT_1360318 [Neocallimastix sp. JGI-2020a]